MYHTPQTIIQLKYKWTQETSVYAKLPIFLSACSEKPWSVPP
jgi:hypothetical protein